MPLHTIIKPKKKRNMSKETKKELLARGLRTLALSLPFIAAGPFVLHLGFQLRNYLTITIGVLLMFVAIYLMFKGLNTILKAFF